MDSHEESQCLQVVSYKNPSIFQNWLKGELQFSHFFLVGNRNWSPQFYIKNLGGFGPKKFCPNFSSVRGRDTQPTGLRILGGTVVALGLSLSRLWRLDSSIPRDGETGGVSRRFHIRFWGFFLAISQIWGRNFAKLRVVFLSHEF